MTGANSEALAVTNRYVQEKSYECRGSCCIFTARILAIYSWRMVSPSIEFGRKYVAFLDFIVVNFALEQTLFR